MPDRDTRKSDTRVRKGGIIDQRQQQNDPAGRHRVDVNAPAKPSMKQPGGPHPSPKEAQEPPDDS